MREIENIEKQTRRRYEKLIVYLRLVRLRETERQKETERERERERQKKTEKKRERNREKGERKSGVQQNKLLCVHRDCNVTERASYTRNKLIPNIRPKPKLNFTSDRIMGLDKGQMPLLVKV